MVKPIKQEGVDFSDYNNFADARFQIGRFLEDVYMTKHIHSFLGYLTPLEFETAWRLAHPVQTTPLESLKNCPSLWVHYTDPPIHHHQFTL
jgi:hypothetical protein